MNDLPKAAEVVPQRLTADIPSPLLQSRFRLFDDEDGLLVAKTIVELEQTRNTGSDPAAFTLAGPRRHLAFRPERLCAGIVTCGGLCPGLNDVIRAVVLTLHHH